MMVSIAVSRIAIEESYENRKKRTKKMKNEAEENAENSKEKLRYHIGNGRKKNAQNLEKNIVNFISVACTIYIQRLFSDRLNRISSNKCN